MGACLVVEGLGFVPRTYWASAVRTGVQIELWI